MVWPQLNSAEHHKNNIAVKSIGLLIHFSCQQDWAAIFDALLVRRHYAESRKVRSIFGRHSYGWAYLSSSFELASMRPVDLLCRAC